MKYTISSPWTIYHKFILPICWLGLGVFVPVIIALQEPDQKWRIQFLLVIGLLNCWVFAILYFLGIDLKWVEIDHDFLYVSNYRKTIRVPLIEVEDVSVFPWINKGLWGSRPTWIQFKRATDFGKQIVFLPKRSVVLSVPHSVADELKAIATEEGLIANPVDQQQ